MTKPVVRWGIIGCGSVTELKSGPAYQQTAGFELSAVMRRDRVKAEDYARRHGVEDFFSDADSLIFNDNIDAVYIATPPDSHLFYALKVAAAGKPCCIEKPMAPSYAQCQTITAAFAEKNLPLFVAYYRRSLPRFLQVKQWLDQQAIGEVRHISWQLTKVASELDLSGGVNWRTDAMIAPGGYFDDLASHGLDLFCFLLGEVSSAKGISLNQQGLYGAKDAITAIWLHENGVTGSGHWHFGCGSRQDIVEIVGSKGRIQFSVFDQTALRLTTVTDSNAHHRDSELFIDNPTNIQLYHVQGMADALFNDKLHPSTGQTASHTSWVMEQILAE